MIVKFSPDKTNILFFHETPKEAASLHKFPGLVKVGLDNGCPAILPVAYNIVGRMKSIFTMRYTAEVKTWLDSDFKLLPIPETFLYHTKPKDFQDIALRFLYTLGSAGLLLDPGMGKTKVVLDYIFLKGFKLSLVACPAALLFVWEDETLIHRPELATYVVKTTDWDKELIALKALLNTNKQVVVVINYSKTVILKHRIKELKID